MSPVLALKVSAALMMFVALGFGLPTAFAAGHLLREGSLPTFIGAFPMYGGGPFQRASAGAFVVFLGLFAAARKWVLCALPLLPGNRLAAVAVAHHVVRRPVRLQHRLTRRLLA
jgi:hypothetical protein